MRTAITLLFVGLLGSPGCSNRDTQTTSAATVTNSDVKQMVQSRLSSDPQLANIQVSADVELNQVTLSGPVPSERTRNEAIDMAKAARPNLMVIDKMDVQPQVVSRGEYTEDMARDTQQKAKALGDKIGQSLDDGWLYTKIKAKLVGNSAAPALKINVDVSQNIVTLRGDVESVMAKQEAEQIAKKTDGVKGVRNLLKVKAT